MQIHPDDSPPKPVDEYAIMLEPSAKNVLLEFKTPGIMPTEFPEHIIGLCRLFRLQVIQYRSTA